MSQKEAQEQKALIQWANATKKNFTQIGRYLFAIPNGANLAGDKRKSAIQMNNLKAQGLKPGVSDLFLPVGRGGFFGLWIEMKAGNNKPTDHQKSWLELMENAGYRTAVCYSWLEARDVIKDYFLEPETLTIEG